MSAVALAPRQSPLVMPPVGGPKRVAEFHSWKKACVLVIRDDLGNRDQYIRWLAPHDEDHRDSWNPNHWNLHRNRVDADGQDWTSVDGPFVMDDFGYLVKAPQ